MRVRVLVLSILDLTMIPPVTAADLALPNTQDYPAVQPASALDWSGFYIGVQGGYALNQIGLNDATDLNGGSVGLFGGYNFVYSGVVLGVENDFNYNWSDGETVGLDWDGSARARAGYAWDRGLFYGTAGVAAASGSVDLATVKKDEILIG